MTDKKISELASNGTGGLFGNNLDVFGNTQIVPTSGATATTANTTQNGGLGGRESKGGDFIGDGGFGFALDRDGRVDLLEDLP